MHNLPNYPFTQFWRIPEKAGKLVYFFISKIFPNDNHPGAQLILAELLKRINDEMCHYVIGRQIRKLSAPPAKIASTANSYVVDISPIFFPKFAQIISILR